MLNIDKGVAHVDNKCKKLEKLSVQQIQDAWPMPASLLNCFRRAKSVSRYQNTELKRLTFLRLHLTDIMFSKAKSASPLIDTRHTSLQQNTGLIKSSFLKCLQTNATISNARSASLFSRGARPASQSQNARAVSILQNVSSASLNPAPLSLASQSCNAKLTFALRLLGSEGS